VCIGWEGDFVRIGSQGIRPVLAFGRVLLRKIEVWIIGARSLVAGLCNCSQVLRAKDSVSHDRSF
jgi:hypothetical protein